MSSLTSPQAMLKLVLELTLVLLRPRPVGGGSCSFWRWVSAERISALGRRRNPPRRPQPKGPARRRLATEAAGRHVGDGVRTAYSFRDWSCRRRSPRPLPAQPPGPGCRRQAGQACSRRRPPVTAASYIRGRPGRSGGCACWQWRCTAASDTAHAGLSIRGRRAASAAGWTRSSRADAAVLPAPPAASGAGTPAVTVQSTADSEACGRRHSRDLRLQQCSA